MALVERPADKRPDAERDKRVTLHLVVRKAVRRKNSEPDRADALVSGKSSLGSSTSITVRQLEPP
jgi:hypothetical protein